MRYGIEIHNPGNDLVLSSEAKGVCCIGKAALVQLVQPYSQDGHDFAGYSVYQIASASPIIVAIDLPLGKVVAVRSVDQVQPGVWQITCYCGNSGDPSQLSAQSPLAVWAYGFATTVLGKWGLAIWDENGVLTHDLTRDQLYPRAYVRIEAAAYSSVFDFGVPGIQRPVVLGSPTAYINSAQQIGAQTYTVRYQRGGWARINGTQILATQFLQERFNVTATDPSDIPDTGAEYFSISSFILEGALLPA